MTDERRSNPPGGSEWQLKRVELPSFYGDNPDDWLSQAERYFSFYHMNDTERVDAAVMNLEGRALLWWQWASQ